LKNLAKNAEEFKKNWQENIPRAQEKEGIITNLPSLECNCFNIKNVKNKHSRP